VTDRVRVCAWRVAEGKGEGARSARVRESWRVRVSRVRVERQMPGHLGGEGGGWGSYTGSCNSSVQCGRWSINGVC